jgi:hypothetical protein
MTSYIKKIIKKIYTWLTLGNIARLITKILILVILYFVGYLVIIPKYSNNFWWKLVTKKLSHDRIALYGVTNRIGENNLHLRLIKAAQNLNIDYVSIAFNDAITWNDTIKKIYTFPMNFINYFFKPQINLASTHFVNYLPIGYNIVYLNIPTSMLMNSDHEFLQELHYLYQYDGYADIYSLVHGQNEYLIKTLSRRKQKFDIYPVYFGDNYKEYVSAQYETALITGSLWGCARNNNRMRRALRYLAEDGLLYGLGLPDLAFLAKGYLGPTNKYSKDPVFTLSEFQKLHGISIVFTTLEHIIEGIPTLRIAEAAAAANLIISDYNLFVRKFFGNSVLYVDVFQNEKELYLQMKEHILWARQHPEEAKAMGAQAYKIFAENFYIEKHLKELISSVKVKIAERAETPTLTRSN